MNCSLELISVSTYHNYVLSAANQESAGTPTGLIVGVVMGVVLVIVLVVVVVIVLVVVVSKSKEHKKRTAL